MLTRMTFDRHEQERVVDRQQVGQQRRRHLERSPQPDRHRKRHRQLATRQLGRDLAILLLGRRRWPRWPAHGTDRERLSQRDDAPNHRQPQPAAADAGLSPSLRCTRRRRRDGAPRPTTTRVRIITPSRTACPPTFALILRPPSFASLSAPKSGHERDRHAGRSEGWPPAAEPLNASAGVDQLLLARKTDGTRADLDVQLGLGCAC